MMRNGRAVDWGNPLLVMGDKARAIDWDPICGLHQGQRSMVPRKQAGHMTCTRPRAERQILLATRASSTHDPTAVIDNLPLPDRSRPPRHRSAWRSAKSCRSCRNNPEREDDRHDACATGNTRRGARARAPPHLGYIANLASFVQISSQIGVFAVAFPNSQHVCPTESVHPQNDSNRM